MASGQEANGRGAHFNETEETNDDLRKGGFVKILGDNVCCFKGIRNAAFCTNPETALPLTAGSCSPRKLIAIVNLNDVPNYSAI